MRPLIVTGSAHPVLAEELARELEAELASCILRRFPDGEQDVEIATSLRGQPVFVVQPLRPPVGEHLVELLLLADACRRAGAGPVAAIVPYLGFARQDRVAREGRPLGAKVIAEALGTARLAQVVAVDLHSPVVAACVEAPVAHLTAVPALVEALRPRVREGSVVVAPDLGAIKLAEAYSSLLGVPLAVVSKRRVSPVHVAVGAVVGDVRGRLPIVVDDMISTGTTIAAAIDALLASGCEPDFVVAATHAVLAPGALERLSRPEVARVVVTDSLPGVSASDARLEVVRLAPLLAEAVRRVLAGRALEELLVAR
jgi:ribose-phosphate pyrophosphokinase